MEVSGHLHSVPYLCLGKENLSIHWGWLGCRTSQYSVVEGGRGGKKHFLLTVGFKPQFFGHPAYSWVIVLACVWYILCSICNWLGISCMPKKMGLLFIASRNTQCFPFIIFLCLTPLLHRKPASASTSHDSCHAQGN